MTQIETERARVRALVAWALAAGLAGCPGPIPPRLSALQERLFTPSCTFSSCHSASGHAGELVLERPGSHQQLVGAAPAQEQAAREGLLRVAPGDPDRSFLVIKLQKGMPARYGKHMPDTNGQLGDDELAAVVEWIRRGALDD